MTGDEETGIIGLTIQAGRRGLASPETVAEYMAGLNQGLPDSLMWPEIIALPPGTE